MAIVRIWRTATKLDPKGIEPGFAIRCTIGVALMLVIGLAVKQPLAGVSAGFGAMLAGFASRQGVYRTRAAVMMLTAGGMALSASIACVTAELPVVPVLLLGVWGVMLGLSSTLGTAATAIATNATIAMIIFSHPPYAPAMALVQPLCILAGGAVQTLLLVLVWPLRRFKAERQALAAVYRALADYARDIPEILLASPGTATLSSAGGALDDPQPFARRADLAAFEALFVEAERVRATLGALATDRHLLARHKSDGAARAVRAIGGRSAAVLAEIAASLVEERAPIVDAQTRDAMNTALRRLEREVESADPRARNDAEQALADARELFGELRTAMRASGVSLDGMEGDAPASGGAATAAAPLRKRVRSAARPFADAWLTVRSNLDASSPALRHALRLAVVLLIAATLERALPLNRSYWIPLTAVIVLRPDFATTFTRGMSRVGGTVLGAILAALIALLHPSAIADAVLALGFAGVAYTVFAANYALFSAAITVYVVFLLALGGASTEDTAAIDRVGATLIGGGLALVAYLLWPSWSREHVNADLSELIDAQREYAAAVLAGFSGKPDAARIRRTQSRAWRARTAAEVAVDQLAAEPVRARTLSIRTALALLGAGRRYGVASLALQSRQARIGFMEAPPLAALIDELDAAMRDLARALHDGTRAQPLPALRAAQTDLVRAASHDERAALRALISETDLMVDAVETMAAALVREYTPSA